MLDFGTLEKPQTPINPVRYGRIEERGFDHPALCIAAVEHRHFLAVDAGAHQLAHLLDHPLRFGEIGGRFVDPHRLARALVL